MRKIIQISTVLGDDYIRAALCDDGTLWESVGGAEWTQVRPIPQPKSVKLDDGWIEWEGGECPVPNGTLIDVKYRGGATKTALRANENVRGVDLDAGPAFWEHKSNNLDIISYRIHNSQTNPKEG